MRSDFHKVLCERPRHKPYNANKRHRKDNLDYEDMPTKENMKINHIRGWGGKELTDHIAPLYRYLNDQVGRKWDDVYSEIRKTIVGKNPNAVKGHILQHIYGWNGVELHSYTLDGKRYRKTSFYHNVDELHDGQLYIDDDGILSRYKTKTKKKKSYQQLMEETWMKTARVLPNGNQARKINGIWYEVTLSPILDRQVYTEYTTSQYTRISRPHTSVLVNDVLGTRGSVEDFVKKYRAKVYASSKRAMNSKDLRKHDLQND